MKVQVLRSAMEDLARGRKFYDYQEAAFGHFSRTSYLGNSGASTWHRTKERLSITEFGLDDFAMSRLAGS